MKKSKFPELISSSKFFETNHSKSDAPDQESVNRLKILLAEDDPNTAFMLKENLRQSGYDVIHAADGQKAIVALNSENFDLALLDIMLPKKDGLQLTQLIKSRYGNLPVILLTARNLLEDRVLGFKSGCDDYVSKPFYFEELALRLEAVLRRSQPHSGESSLKVGEVYFHTDQNKITSRKKEILLTPTESKIIQVFAEHFGKTVPRDLLLERVWGVASVYTSRTFDVYLNRLRKLLKPLKSIEIENTHGLGYKMKTSD